MILKEWWSACWLRPQAAQDIMWLWPGSRHVCIFLLFPWSHRGSVARVQSSSSLPRVGWSSHAFNIINSCVLDSGRLCPNHVLSNHNLETPEHYQWLQGSVRRLPVTNQTSGPRMSLLYLQTAWIQFACLCSDDKWHGPACIYLAALLKITFMRVICGACTYKLFFYPLCCVILLC